MHASCAARSGSLLQWRSRLNTQSNNPSPLHTHPTKNKTTKTTTQVFVDADLSALGAPPPRYAAHAAALRRAHRGQSDADYLAARARRLRALLDRERLFATDAGASLLEAAARANLAHELQLALAGVVIGDAAAGEGELPAVAEGDEEEGGE